MASFVGIYPCADGHIGVRVMARNGEPFAEGIGRPGFLTDGRFALKGERTTSALGDAARLGSPRIAALTVEAAR